MLDIKELYINYETIKNNILNRGFVINKDVITHYLKLKEINQEIELINGRLNRGIGLENDKVDLKKLKEEALNVTEQYKNLLDNIPNVLHDTVPLGKDAADNVELRVIEGLIINNDNYMEIAQKNGLDVKAGVDLACARFNVMHGKVAKLHRKLINKALDYYEDMGYQYHYVPNLVTKETMYGTGQYPKFKDDLFETTNGLYLIPTGEVPLTNLFANKILNEKTATNKLLTHTPCFRKEVGAYGKDTKGIIRQHQFEKVELVRTCLPEDGLNTFNEMVEDVEKFVQQLGLKYRVIELCTGDIGFAGHKANDIEIWFPNTNEWKEIATITWCFDFQARRMNAKVKRNNGTKELIHTLNGTGLAVGRVLAGLIEQKGEEAFNLFEI